MVLMCDLRCVFRASIAASFQHPPRPFRPCNLDYVHFFFQELTNVGTLADAGIYVNAKRNHIVSHDVMQGDKHLNFSRLDGSWAFEVGLAPAASPRGTFLAPSRLVGARRIDRIGLISTPHFPRKLDAARAGCSGSCVVNAWRHGSKFPAQGSR